MKKLTLLRDPGFTFTSHLTYPVSILVEEANLRDNGEYSIGIRPKVMAELGGQPYSDKYLTTRVKNGIQPLFWNIKSDDVSLEEACPN